MKAIAFLFALTLAPLGADPGLKDRLKDQHGKGQTGWIYNDLAAGMAKARETNKPILVTFRCVPCHACMKFDGLAAGGSPKLKALADKFITVRQVEMKGVDLSLFQFDYDLNWAAMFLNADGTIYARYGTQSQEGPDAFNSVESFAATMERVLKLHQGYPGNKKGLSGKTGPRKSYKTALEMPGLPNKASFRKQTQIGNCIHCHNIHDAENFEAFDRGRLTQESLWRYPLPENIGLRMKRDDGVVIEKVVAGGAAERAGMESGARIVAMNGQIISSIADMQWVLHRLPNVDAKLQIDTKTADSRTSVRLRLAKDWKKTDFSWRGSLFALPPSMKIYLPEANDQERRRQRVPKGTEALAVRWINQGQQAGKNAVAAGLRTGDVVVEIDGEPVPKGGHRGFNHFVKTRFKPGDKLPLTLLRNGKKVKVSLPLIR